jgi:hypothetical protein
MEAKYRYHKGDFVVRNRLVAIALVLSMVLPLAGCGANKSKPAMSEKLMIEAIVNDENVLLTSEGVELRVDPVFVTSDVKASISRVSNAPALDEESGLELSVYDFKLEGVSQVDGAIILTIPLDLAQGQIPGAAFLNEETLQWEPVAFHYDTASASVQIYTDHLSKYGVFSTQRQGSRRANVEFLGLYGESDDQAFLSAIEEYSIGGVPAAECYEIGSAAIGDALQIGNDILGGIGQSAGYLAYGEDVLSTLGDYTGNIGLLLSVVQIGTNLYNGKIHDAVVSSLKTSFSYVLGKVTSKLSSSVMSASMAAVAIVDYSINKFGTTAIEGRADIYREAYAIYYAKGEKGFKGSDYWFKTFYPMFTDPNMTEAALKAEIDRIVTAHCNDFWTSANGDGVDWYVTEARNIGFTGGAGAGLNKALEESISQERRANLYNDVLPGVFNQIALKINMENERKLRAEYKALSDYLNSVVSFSVTDPKKTYAKHQVRFSPLNDDANISSWTGTFKDDGTLNTSFTLYGHLYAGSPYKLDIYKPDADLEKDKPVETIEFKVTPPAVNIVLAEEPGRLTRLITQRSTDDVVSQLLVEDEYKSYYVEDVYPVPLEHLLTQQVLSVSKDNTINVSLTGDWAAAPVSGKNSAGGEWSTSYKYTVNHFDLQTTLSVNSELPVKGTNRKGLVLAGTGTYSYSVTVTTIMTSSQEVPALFEKARTDGVKTRTVTFQSSGDVEIYTNSKKIDDTKDIIIYENEIDNLETKGIILEFKNPVNQASGTETTYTKTVWEDKQEKEETQTNEISVDPTVYMPNGSKIYFKYPLE